MFDNRGMSLVEVMVSLGLVGAVALATAGITSTIMASRNVLDINQVALAYQLEQAAILKDMSGWLSQNRDKSSVFESCFVQKQVDPSTGTPVANDTRTFSCPEATSLAPDLAKDLGGIAANFTFSSLPVYGVLGNQIAGTASAPLFLTYDGRPCTNNCPIMAVGYVGRTNSGNSANPGKMLSVVALVQNPAAAAAAKNQPFRNRLFPLYADTQWEFPGDNALNNETSTPKDCDSNEVSVGLLANGKAVCKSLEMSCSEGQYSTGFDENGAIKCVPFNFKSCPATQYISAMRPDGEVICNDLPTPPPPDPPPPPVERFSKNVECGSGNYKLRFCDTGLPPGDVITVIAQHSKKKCVLGKNFGLHTPTQIWVNDGCRAVFNISNVGAPPEPPPPPPPPPPDLPQDPVPTWQDTYSAA